jgi:hypothetical protein
MRFSILSEVVQPARSRETSATVAELARMTRPTNEAWHLGSHRHGEPLASSCRVYEDGNVAASR